MLNREQRRLGLALLASAVINTLFFLSFAFGFSNTEGSQVSEREFAPISIAFSRRTPETKAVEPSAPETLPEEIVQAPKVQEELKSTPAQVPETTQVQEATEVEAGDSKQRAVQPQKGIEHEGAGQSSPSGSVTEGISEDQFLLILQELINQNLEYPRRARQRGTEGTVVVALRIEADGSLAGRKISTGSGSSTLDRAALNLIDSIFPVAEPPMQALECRVGISYRLN